jgi:hypothetical protein
LQDQSFPAFSLCSLKPKLETRVSRAFCHSFGELVHRCFVLAQAEQGNTQLVPALQTNENDMWQADTAKSRFCNPTMRNARQSTADPTPSTPPRLE